MSSLDSNNTVSRVATRMLRGVELVTEAQHAYRFPSENWAYPIKVWGESFDPYCAECWSSGMDWNYTVWLIERVNYGTPTCWPILHFDKGEDRAKVRDFDTLLEAIFWKRRDDTWIKSGDDGIYNDSLWTYIREVEYNTEPRPRGMTSVQIKHASQTPISFWINSQVLPDDRKIKI